MRVLGKGSAKPLILVLLAAALLGGCVPKQYSDKQEKELVETCQPAIEKFLADRYGEYELGEVHLLKALIEPEKPLLGNYGSNIVRGSYTVGGNTWNLVYDSETGQFYTDELLEMLMEQETARILEYLKAELPEEDLREFRLTVFDLYYQAQSHNIIIDNHKNTADTYVYINNVLPAGITAEDLPAFAERGFDGGSVSWIRCHYFSDRKNALTEEAFQSFFADNPAYQAGLNLTIDNDNPSAKEESGGGSENSSEADVNDVQENTVPVKSGSEEAERQSGDPLQGLAAEDILTGFRAAQPPVQDNGIPEEAYRLGVWVQDSIGMDRLPADVRALEEKIGKKYEFWFGSDISNNPESNFPKIYEAYYTLKDYYTSGGSAAFYEEVLDENEFFGNGDPETIRMMYNDMQEFITACNNVIREKKR